MESWSACWKRWGKTATVVATGGLASLIGTGSKYIKHVDDLLTLDGLRLIWERNAVAKPGREAASVNSSPVSTAPAAKSWPGASPGPAEWFVENYFNYFTEIEEHFQRRRGGILLLSTLDWALIETWKDAGIPLEAVLRGIDGAFERYEKRPSTTQSQQSGLLRSGSTGCRRRDEGGGCGSAERRKAKAGRISNR